MDTNLPAEARRWVFPQVCDGLREVGREVVQPRHFIKLCGRAEELMAALPSAWQLRSPSYFMMATDRQSAVRRLPDGYKLRTIRNGATTVARIFAPEGRQAASGYAAEAMDVFIYDRIETAPEHRRKGLGNVIMTALRFHRRSTSVPELLVATEDGHGLYTSLGWRVLSPYSTAVIPD
ncbi:GNAT family N-acetyltransferase [Sphingomonas oryzagri]